LAEAQRNDNDGVVRDKAKEAMKKIGPPSSSDVAHLLEVFTDKKAPKQMRSAAAQGLALAGGDARVTVPALEEGLRDADPAVRVAAAAALWSLAGKQPENLATVLSVLIAGLKDFDPAVRAAAAQGLVALGGDAKEAAGLLETALADSDPLVRERAARA